jgi:hypothetical protein
MKTVLDAGTRDELLARLDSLNENCNAQWGRMNVYQMVKHCTRWDDMMLGNIKVNRMLLGKLFGKTALKTVLKDEAPLRKNSPTAAELIIKERSGDFSLRKAEWKRTIGEYEHFSAANFIHPFFGSMTREQVGQFVYKHHDHHLRQFGA